MLRILRAFLWLRWRVFVNSLERTGARDTLERFSIAMEQITPLIAIVLLVPSMLGAAGLGAAAGYTLVSAGSRPFLFDLVRYLLVAAMFLSIVGPIAMPAGERTNAVRLLLLPISRATLYVAHIASTVADPWILLVVPMVALLPGGLASGGSFFAAAVGSAAAVLLIAALVGLSALATSLLHLLVRDRRRGELIALAFILVLPIVSMLPAIFEAKRDAAGDRAVRRPRETPAWVQTARRAASYAPTELYVAAIRGAAADVRRPVVRPLAALAGITLVVHALGAIAYRRLLDSPASTASGLRTVRGGWSFAVPGFSPGASAVALTLLRLALRTPRGRSMLFSPLILVFMFGAMMYRGGGGMQLGLITLESGIGLATFGAFGALLTVLPIAMNQFAVDGAGLTLTWLSPLSDGDVLVGKALGAGLILAGPALVSIAVALAAFPGGSPWLWLAIPIALAATYVLVTPAAAALSAIFPRAVDMNSIGRGSNAHGLAALLGFAACLASGLPCALLVLLATRVLHQPAIAVLLLLLWLGLTIPIALAVFVPVRKLFAARRENLAMVV